MAMALKIDDNHTRWVYCTVGDGELNEGNNWEAIMFAAKNKLHNLIVIVDRNNIQIDGNTENVMPLEPFRDKWEAFGWHTQEIDGHNIESVIDACSMARAVVEKPSVIIAHTIPGKGVPFMEYDYHWHGGAPNSKQAKEALQKLRSMGGRISGDHD
jgi:transketolase